MAYVLTTMMQSVIDNGTGYPVRARGFTAPAAGKTGTSHDAWFAGYTTNLLCIVWVGNDDYTDLKLAGGATAAPIWAEFMKRAVKVPQYSDPKPFSAPDGVVVEQIDKVTNMLATPSCPADLHRRLSSPAPSRSRPATRHSPTIAASSRRSSAFGSPPAAPPPADTNGAVQTTARRDVRPAAEPPAAQPRQQPAEEEARILGPAFWRQGR